MISELGFKKGSIVECIVTTYNEDKSSNAAPMGIITENEKEVSINIHTSSDTYYNIIRNRCCVLNIVFDPYLFLKTALSGSGKAGAEPEVCGKEVGKSEVNAPFLKDAAAYIEAVLVNHKEETEFSHVRCSVSKVVVEKKHPFAVNRGLYAAVEAAIALSRGSRDIEGHMDIMRKALPQGEYSRIEKLLEEYI
ncbi:MAG: DUF447 domain-containing protein [Candidatus Hydrothermarchaeaceae archaeon]